MSRATPGGGSETASEVACGADTGGYRVGMVVGRKRVRTALGRSPNQQDKTHSTAGRARATTTSDTRLLPFTKFSARVLPASSGDGPLIVAEHAAALGVLGSEPRRLLAAGRQVRQEAALRERRLRRRLLRGVVQGTVREKVCPSAAFVHPRVFLCRCTSPGDADSCQMLSRKKRRGVIEKKRRDRINTSLSELKRLVPSAFEKQGSAKLEKAEILQMTVDHLKMIHAKGKIIRYSYTVLCYIISVRGSNWNNTALLSYNCFDCVKFDTYITCGFRRIGIRRIV